ncbi:hypothetical protein N7516_005459 [Penicillium verrucosum]|uniref:uncharacterized protein n=1 Tax=Penicillium verrucosum TaxID=60171 RepID=UPI002544F5D3|nr:uncharacterized protein N7516_005459 [Penicillium verrucosum]KAJ5945291.1 hypothetical protein N7516_005459 [Penicillium verrucosum]
MGDPRIPCYENEAGKEGAMATSELPRDFLEPDSSMNLQSLGSDFHIPDEAKRLTRPTKKQITRNIEEIAREIDMNLETSQYLLIINPSDTLRTYFLNSRVGGVRLTIDDHNILLRIMPGNQHKSVLSKFATRFPDAMTTAGLPAQNRRWRPTGGSLRRGAYCGKEPDFSMAPVPHILSTSVSIWPSLVIEVGMSQSHSSLKRDAQWWFENSSHNTRLVLLFNIHKDPFWVDVELWMAPTGTRPGLPTRQNAIPDSDHPGEFIPREELGPLSVTQAVRVTDGAVSQVKGQGLDISLDYELLMREGRPTGQEDIVITEEMLQWICEEVPSSSG